MNPHAAGALSSSKGFQPSQHPNESDAVDLLNARNVVVSCAFSFLGRINGLDDPNDMKIIRFEDLECWQQARVLVNMVYDALKASSAFQKDFRLSGQITGAAISVMNNIAEGWASQSNAEFIRFLLYSRRSCPEIQNCLYVAVDQHYIDQKKFDEIYAQATRTIQIIDGFLRYLRSRRNKEFKKNGRIQPKIPDGDVLQHL